MRPLGLFATLLLTVLFAAVAQGATGEGAMPKDHEFRQKIAEINAKTGARQLSIAELQQKLQRGERVVILDVREPEEMLVSTLPGARPAPPDQIRSRPLGDLPAGATIVAYCTVGYRSGKAAVQLEKRLGRPVYNLDGGILAWFNAGGRVVDPAGQPVDRIDAWGAPWTSYVHPR